MDLPTGKWAANFSGIEGTLDIEQVSATGDVQGKVFRPDMQNGSVLIAGIWDGTAQKLRIAARPSTSKAVDDEWLEAYLFSTPRNPAPGEDMTLTLAGIISVLNFSLLPKYNANMRRTTFGWFAQIKVVN